MTKNSDLRKELKKHYKDWDKKYTKWNKNAEKWQEKKSKQFIKEIKKHEETKVFAIFLSVFISSFLFLITLNILYNIITEIIKTTYISVNNIIGFFILGIFFSVSIACWKFASLFNKKFNNNFLILIMIFLVGLIYFGLLVVQIIYPSYQSFLSFTNIEKNNTILSISCGSAPAIRRDMITESDYFHCDINFTNMNQFKVKTNEIKMYNQKLPIYNYSDYLNYYCYLSTNYNETDSCKAIFAAGPEGTHEFQFILSLKYDNDTDFTTVTTGFYTYYSLSDQEYNKRQTEKVALFATLIIGAIFSPFVAVKNFMDIWDRKKNR